MVNVESRVPSAELLDIAALDGFRAILIASCLYIIAASTIYPNDYGALLPLYILQIPVFMLSLIAVVFCVRILIKHRSAPLQAWRAEARRRAMPIVLGTVLFVLGMTAFTTFKVNMPHIVPFYANPVLARLDAIVHGGNPWSIAWRAPPQIAYIVDFLYTRVWPFVMIVSFCIGLLFLEGRALQRCLWAFIFVYLCLGGLVATLVSSVGPIFYADFYPDMMGFAAEKAAILANPGLDNIGIYSNYLLDNYRSSAPAFGTGISAFPSVHVAVAVMAAWLFTSLGRIGAVLGWLFVLSIEYGSIYSGWHYGVGGYFSILAVSVFWIAISRYLGLPLIPAKTAPKGTVGSPPSATA